MKSRPRFALIFALTTAAIIPFLSTGDAMAEGNVTKAERTVGEFQQLELQDSIDVYLTQGPVKPAVIEAEESLISQVELVKTNKVLQVRMKHDSFFGSHHFSSHHPINVYLTAPDVNSLSVAGSGDIKLTGKLSEKDRINVSLSGSGGVSGELNAPTVKASIAGSGDIKVNGKTRDLNVAIAGSGSFDGPALLSENTSVSVVGSGDAHVYASKELTVRIAGSGDVTYSGEPQVSSKVIGSGSVQKKK
ncbi:head GIN domain-containing protein [Paraherbaspirillum soli]|uniref:Head GIN domain-containing protein n=1 Tax=Paraherbaspirillum soli TaxID=631222 RepID=A0ABW0MD51_9BURK